MATDLNDENPLLIEGSSSQNDNKAILHHTFDRNRYSQPACLSLQIANIEYMI
jgi:hypothetical protein